MNTRLSPLAIILLAGLLGVAFALSIVNLNVALPYAQWRQALWQPDVDDIAQMLFHYSLLPRLAVALLVGAGLGLVGVLFQQVLRNPLAEPTTLGVATRRAAGDNGHHVMGYSRRAGVAIRRAGRGLSGGRAGVWRLVGQAPVAA